MGYYLTKISITVILVIVISEIAKRSSLIGALLASIPIVSVLAMVWLYVDTKDVVKVAQLSSSVFWLVLPSLALFISLPWLLKNDINFYISLSISIVITVLCYLLMIKVLSHFGVEF